MRWRTSVLAPWQDGDSLTAGLEWSSAVTLATKPPATTSSTEPAAARAAEGFDGTKQDTDENFTTC